MSIQRINRIKEIFAKAKENWKPSLHLLTDDDLDDLEGIIKSDNLSFLSIDKAEGLYCPRKPRTNINRINKIL